MGRGQGKVSASHQLLFGQRGIPANSILSPNPSAKARQQLEKLIKQIKNDDYDEVLNLLNKYSKRLAKAPALNDLLQQISRRQVGKYWQENDLGKVSGRSREKELLIKACYDELKQKLEEGDLDEMALVLKRWRETEKPLLAKNPGPWAKHYLAWSSKLAAYGNKHQQENLTKLFKRDLGKASKNLVIETAVRSILFGRDEDSLESSELTPIRQVESLYNELGLGVEFIAMPEDFSEKVADKVQAQLKSNQELGSWSEIEEAVAFHFQKELAPHLARQLNQLGRSEAWFRLLDFDRVEVLRKAGLQRMPQLTKQTIFSILENRKSYRLNAGIDLQRAALDRICQETDLEIEEVAKLLPVWER